MIETVYLLNSAILTAYGNFKYKKMELQEVKEFLLGKNLISAIGNKSTARVISTLLKRECPVNRITYTQGRNETALIFKLNERVPEGKILSKKEIEEIGYHWGLLFRDWV